MGVEWGWDWPTLCRTTGHLPPPSEPASDPQLPRLWGLSVPTHHWRFWKTLLSAESESCYHEHRQDLETRFLTLLGSYRRALPKGRLARGRLNSPPTRRTQTQSTRPQPTSQRPVRESSCVHTPAGCQRLSPEPQGGGARIPRRAAPRFHVPAPAPVGHRSTALVHGTYPGLHAPAAHRAPFSSSPGPLRRAHTHLTSAPTQARRAAPDAGP